ncbi:MAG: glycosyltransferase family 4 protein [Methanomassiliicoccales archaeon]
MVYSHKNPLSFVLLPLRMTIGMMQSDLCICWFADWHSLFAVIAAKALGKPCITIAAGYDAAKEPAIGYGSFNRPWFKRVPSFVFRHCDEILAVSEHTKTELIANAKADEARISVVYLGVPGLGDERPTKTGGIVVTVANVTDRTFVLKGVDSFVKIADKVPQAKFVAVGYVDERFAAEKHLRDSLVEFRGRLPQPELFELFREAKVCVQLSYDESFGMAVAESMARECVPVVSDRGGLPEVVGDCGYIVHYGDLDAAAEATAKALSDDTTGPRARARVESKFSCEARKRALARIIERRITGKGA